MSDTRTFRLIHQTARLNCKIAIDESPDGYMVAIKPPTRTSDQNSKFHALCSDIAKSDVQWAGKKRTAAQWKGLFVSGHAIATNEGADMVPGLENEFVNLRESTALMSVKRGSSLIEYTLAFCATNGVRMYEYGRLTT